MSDVPARSGPSTSGRWALIYVLLAPAVVLPLWVALYDREDPTLFGFPFFFWFQFALILGAAALTITAYAVASRADAQDRATRKARRDAGRDAGRGAGGSGR